MLLPVLCGGAWGAPAPHGSLGLVDIMNMKKMSSKSYNGSEAARQAHILLNRHPGRTVRRGGTTEASGELHEPGAGRAKLLPFGIFIGFGLFAWLAYALRKLCVRRRTV